jgi:hypothetical protein
MEKFTASRQGGFWRWMFSLKTAGSFGEISYDEKSINWKSSFMNFGGQFNRNIDELETITNSKYIDYLIFPRKCYLFSFSDGKKYKFKIPFEQSTQEWQNFKNKFSSKFKNQ